jgi:hypothetical protein
MVAAIAAFRAGQAPHIVQMFEVGTGTMMAAGRAMKPLHELLAETNTQIPFDDYLPAVRGYYSLRDGRMMSMPFNSSTAVAFYNKDAFRRANLNPDQFPQTWEGVEQAARALKAAGVACPMTTAWPTWTQVEQFSAIHNIPLATQGNGFGGLNAELRINNPLMVRHLTNLVDWQREGLFRYGGRDGAGDALFPSTANARSSSPPPACARASSARRSSSGVSPCCPTMRARRADQRHHRRRQLLGDEPRPERDAQRREPRHRAVLRLARAARGRAQVACRHGLPAGDGSRLPQLRRRPASTPEPRRRHPDPAAAARRRADDGELDGHPPRRLRRDPHHHPGGDGARLPGPAERRAGAEQRGHARQRRCCATSSGRTAAE